MGITVVCRRSGGEMTNKNESRYKIRTMRDIDGKQKRFCDIVKNADLLFVETKQGKEINRIELEDFLYQVDVAKKLLR